MIATFLKKADGNFDYPSLVFALPALFFALVSGWVIILALRTGRISFTALTVVFHTERDKSPIQFWFFIMLYLLGVLFFGFIALALCTGMMRTSHGN